MTQAKKAHTNLLPNLTISLQMLQNSHHLTTTIHSVLRQQLILVINPSLSHKSLLFNSSPDNCFSSLESRNMAVSERLQQQQQQLPAAEKKPRFRPPLPVKTVVLLAAACFFLGLLLSSGISSLVASENRAGIACDSKDCDRKRRLEEAKTGDVMDQVSRTHQVIQALDKSVSKLEMELAVGRMRLNGGRGGGRGGGSYNKQLKKAFVVVGINTAFSSQKRREAVRATWMPTGAKLKRLEEEKGVVVRFVIGHSATSGGAVDRAIDEEDAETKDFLRLDHLEGYHKLSAKTRAFFSTAVAIWDADFFVKVDDDVHLNLGMLVATLAQYRNKPRVYIGCMKSGPVLYQKDVKYHEPEFWKFGEEGNKYFRHATGQIYAISKDLASYISINAPILHKYANEDVSLGSWLIGLEVKHIDERRMCCGTPPDCEWKAESGNFCIASFDWPCSGVCKPVERMKEVHGTCGEAAEAIWNVAL